MSEGASSRPSSFLDFFPNFRSWGLWELSRADETEFEAIIDWLIEILPRAFDSLSPGNEDDFVRAARVMLGPNDELRVALRKLSLWAASSDRASLARSTAREVLAALIELAASADSLVASRTEVVAARLAAVLDAMEYGVRAIRDIRGAQGLLGLRRQEKQ